MKLLLQLWRRARGGSRLHDWQLDINDDGVQIGRCPICHSHYVNFSGYNRTRAECFDCGYTKEGITS